ncbi:MAG TPA: dienelactone hydrolase family protein [Candidatus Cybelea sp.]|jgi:carboxymethylenebutenolidase|nr:dienelactone hydrolase family protein [Candidatus Cybelea sp.]
MTSPEIDPTQAASPELSRRVFVGISAAALSAPVAALAHDGGKPHPPLVSEDDPAIVVQRVTLDRPDLALPAYSARPKDAGAGTPSVVVIMHVWGVDTTIRDVVRRLAKAGLAAIAPDLYARFNAPSGDGSTDYTIFRPYAKQLDRAQYGGDIAAAAKWCAAQLAGTKTAVMGFCMGGRIALLASIDDATVFSAAAPFYGPLEDVDPAKMSVPVCGSYGARDTGIPAQGVRDFAAALKVPNDFKIYDDAGHAFCDDQRPSYVAPACADAWERVLAFLGKYLRPGTG